MIRIAHTGMSTSLFAVLLTFTTLLAGCDKRTPEEKGRDLAEKKLGMAEGAAKVLEEKGKKLGTSMGTGVSEMVKGAGSAAKDTMYPPVKAAPTPQLVEAGIQISDAHEGNSGTETREVVTTLLFTRAYTGRLDLRAFDAATKETGRSPLTENLIQAAGSNTTMTFQFPGAMRLSKVDHYELHGSGAKSVALAADLMESGIDLSQLAEEENQVTLYAIFNKAFRNGLALRVYDATGQEIGRSEPTVKLIQEADSSQRLAFRFDPGTPLTRADKYVVYPAKPAPVASKGAQR